MSINLAIQFHHPDAVAHLVRYARIDNTTNPVFVTVAPNPVSSPAVIATNIPDGQYQIQSTPIYADGRVCDPEVVQTDPCPGLESISGRMQGNILIVSYLAPSSVPKIRLTVLYPNGGSFAANYVNDGNDISIGLPVGVFGNYSLSGQSVCDETSGFYSPSSSTVTVAYNSTISSTFRLSNTPGGTCAADIITLYSNGAPVPGTALFTDSTLTNRITGSSFALLNGIIYNLGTADGILGSDTGTSCNTPARINGLTFYDSNNVGGPGTITGTPGQSVTVFITASGPPGGTYTLNVKLITIGNLTVTNGSNSLTFTMPPSGVISFIGNYTFTDNNGSGTISLG